MEVQTGKLTNMQKQILIKEQAINYTLKTSSRARRLRLAIYADGSFVVTKPRSLPENFVERFILDKAAWILKKMTDFKQYSGMRFNFTPKDYQAQKAAASAFIAQRIRHYNEYYHFTYHKVSVRNQKTCWGSCTRSGNLSFNFKILHLPAALADYIIVHELCHLKEFNHSKKFWQLVGETMPDYNLQRKTLKQAFRL